MLAAERTLLNLLCHLSGVATLTAAYVRAAAPAAVLDTRKTTPGMRALEKAAVVAGGGANHRMGLFDRVLVKDNHLALAGAGLAERGRRGRAASCRASSWRWRPTTSTASARRWTPARTGSCWTT